MLSFMRMPLQGGNPQQPFPRQDLVDFRDRWHAPPHQAYKDRHHDRQRQVALAHADDPCRLPGGTPLQLARRQ